MLFRSLNPFASVLEGFSRPSGGVRQTITWANLTQSSSTTDATSFATASISPAANKLGLFTVTSAVASGTPNAPTVTGASLTLTQVSTEVQGTRRTTVFRSLNAAPGSGALTIDFSAQTQTACIWSYDEATNASTEGSNGSGAIVQTKTFTSAAQGTTLSITFDSALENAKNSHFCAVQEAGTVGLAVDSDFTILGAATYQTTPSVGLMVQYAANQTNCTSTVANVAVAAISIEVKAAEL